MAQIKKYKRGQEIEQLGELDAQIQVALQSATDEQKALALKLAANARKYNSVDAMTNRDERRFQIDMKKAILATLKGEQAYNPLDMTVADKNLFGFYSRPEVTSITNEITSKTLNRGVPQGGVGSGISVVDASELDDNPDSRYQYAWNRGWNPLNINDESLTSKMQSLVDHFITNTSSLIKASDDGKTIFGTTYDMPIYKQALDNLKMLKGRLNETTAKSLFKDLAKISGMLGMDQNSFDLYFGDLLPVPTAAEQNMAQLKAEGYDFTHLPTDLDQFTQELIAKYKYKLGMKDGQVYVFGENYDRLTGPKTHINYDYTSNGYNHGIMINENGQLWRGNVTDTNDLATDSDFYKQYQNWLGSDETGGIRQQQYNLFTHNKSELDPLFSMSDDAVVQDATALYRRTYGHNMKVIDVSPLFKGDETIIAASKTGSDIKRDHFGNIILTNPDLTFYKKDGDTVKEVSFNQIRNLFNHSGYGEQVGSAGDVKDLLQGRNIDGTDFTLGDHYISDGSDSWWDHHKLDIPGALGLLGPAELFISHDDSEVNEKPMEALDKILNILIKDRKDWTSNETAFLNKLGAANNPHEFMTQLVLLIRNHLLEDQVYSDPERRRLIQLCLQKYENGGVIAYAAEGRVLDRYGNAVTPGTAEDESMRRLTRSVDSLEEDYGGMDPRDAGFAAAGDRAVFDEGFHASDYIRIGTIGADIASMVSAFLGPEGMTASGILGLASTAGTLVADLADDSVSTGETIKGLGIGLGLSVLGMIPGWGAEATGIRTLKTVAKYVPKVINLAMAGMITLNPDTIESLKKAVDGNKHNKLTVKDWRNIGYAFQAVAGLTRSGRGAYLMKQGKNQARVATGKGPKMSVLDKEGKKIEIPKEQQEAFREAAKNDDVEGMNSILKEITGKEEAGVKTETSKKYKLFGEEQTHLADNAISETAQEYAYDWSKLNPEQFGSLGDKYSNANWVRQAVAADQARGFNPFTWRRKAAAAAKANDAAVTRSAREADIRTRWAERAKLRKPIETGISEESISAQEAAMQRAEATHNSAQEAAGRRQRVAHEDMDIEQAAARDARKKTESDFEANELDLRAKEATKEATAWKKKYLQTEEKIDKAQSKLDKTSDPEKAKKIRKELSDLKKEIKSLRKEGREKYNVSTKPGQKYRDTASAKDFEAEFRASADNTRTAGYEQRRSQMRQELTRQAESDKAKVAGRRSSIDQTAKDERLQALREFRSKTAEAASTGTTSADTQVRAAAKSLSVTISKGTKVTNAQHASVRQANSLEAEFKAKHPGAVELNAEDVKARTSASKDVRKALYDPTSKELLILKHGAKLDKLHAFINNK